MGSTPYSEELWPIRQLGCVGVDEQGSDEYDLALGMRRATAVMRYLVDRGIASRRITTASNGEERPICQEHGESCWTQNRRAEIAITRGAESIAHR